MQEALKKVATEATKPIEKSVTLCLESKKMLLNGTWSWEMHSPAIYCSDVMSFPEDFIGTKGIIHPDDLPNVKAAVDLLKEKDILRLDFRIITTFGEVKYISGKRVSFDANNKAIPDMVPGREPWEEFLQQLVAKKEHDFFQLRKDLSDYTERMYGIGSWMVNRQSGQTWYSDSLFQLYGLAPQSLNVHANTFNSFIHHEDIEAVQDAFEKAYDGSFPLHIEFRVIGVDGFIRNVQLMSTWIFNQNGEEIFCGVVRDVTEERKMIEDILTAHSKTSFHQDVLKLLQQQTSTGYWFINLQTKQASYSDNYYRIYGIRQFTSASPNSFLHLVHEDDKKRVEDAVNKMFKEKVLPEIEFRIIRTDGKLRYLKQSAKLFDSANKEELMIGVVQDVTVIRGLEKKILELNESLALNQMLHSLKEESSELSTVTWLPDGSMVWSEGFQNLLGIKTSTEASEKLLYKSIYGDDLKKFKEVQTLAAAGEITDFLSVKLITKTGTKTISVSFRKLNGEKNILVGVVKDITKQIAVEKEFADNQSFAELLSDASNDIFIFSNTDNIITSWNAKAEEKIGISKDQALYNNLFEVLPIAEKENFVSQLQQANEGVTISAVRSYNAYFNKSHDYWLYPLKQGEEVIGVLHVVRDVSKQLELQQQLTERVAFIERLLQSSVDRIVVLDRFMNYLYWNKKAEEYYGISKEKVIAKNILEIFPSFRNDPGYSEFRRVLKGETVYLPANISEDNDEYAETYLTPLKDEWGEVTAILWIVHDLSTEWQLHREQEISAQKIREQAHYLQRITETTPDMISIMELSTRKFTFLNAQTFKANGFDVDKIAEQSEVENTLMVHPDDRQILSNYFMKFTTLSDDDVISEEYRAKDINNMWGRYLVRGKVFQRNEEGEPTHILNAIENITDRKKAEAEVKTKQELLQATMDSSPEMIQVFEAVRDDKGEIVDFIWILNNHTSEEIYGDVIGKSLLQNNPGVIEEGIFDTFKKVVETGVSNQQERYYVHEQFNGWFIQSVVKLNDGIVTTTIDITQIKKADQDLLQNKKLLQTAIDSTLDIIQVFKAIRNKDNKIVDFVWLMNNSKGVEQNGGVIGESLLSKNPGVINTGIFDKMVKVVDTGIPVEQEQYYKYEQFNGWFYQAIVKSDDGVVMTTRDITQQKKTTEEILRLKDELAQQATDKYRTIFNSIDEGFSIIELIFDNTGKPIDFIYRENNPAFVRNVGMDLRGRRRSELDLDQQDFLLKKYEHLAKTGEPLHFEYNVESLGGQWFQVTAARIGQEGSKHLGVIFRNITDRKHLEQQQKYFLRLNDALRPLSNPLEIQRVAMMTLGEMLQVDRVLYSEMVDGETTHVITNNYVRDGVSKIIGRFPARDFSDFTDKTRNGNAFAVRDIANHELLSNATKAAFLDLNVHSVIGVAWVKDNRWIANLSVHHGTPRSWSEHEIILVEETAERTWAAIERAKIEQALRKSEENFRTYVSSSFDVVYKMSADWKTMYQLDGKGFIPSATNTTSWIERYIPDHEKPRITKAIRESIEAKKIFELQHQVIDAAGKLSWTYTRAIPVLDEQGEIIEWMGTATDITNKKESEESLQRFNASLENMVTEGTSELKHHKDLLQSVFDASLQGIILFNVIRSEKGSIQDYEVVLNNAVTQRWNGRDLTGKFYSKEFPTIKKYGILDAFNKVMETGEPSKLEVKYEGEGFKNWFIVTAIKLSEDELLSTAEDITERKNSEEELTKNLTILQHTEQMAQSGSWEYETATGNFTWSDGMYRLFGFSKQMKVLPETYLDFAGKEDRSVAKRIVNNLKKKHQSFEERIKIRKGNDERLLFIKGSVVQDEKGRIQKIIGVDLDITDIQKAEEKVKESRHWLEQTTKASPDSITVYDLQKKHPLYLNNCLAEWTGINEDSLVEMGVEGRLKLIYDDDRLKLLHFNEKVAAANDGELITMEYRIKGKEGNIIWLRNRSKPFQRDASGKVTHLLSILQNVTDEIELREQLNNRTQFAEAILDSSVDRITVFDTDYRFIGWNKRCEQIHRKTKEEVIGKTIFEIFPGVENYPEFMQSQERSIKGEFVHVPAVKDGFTGDDLELFYMPLRNEAGQTYAVVNIMHDVSDYILSTQALSVLNKKLENKNAELEQKNEEITSFAFVASHDMKEPLRKIHTFSDWLMQQEMNQLSEMGKSLVEKINASVHRMEILIDDILVLTKIHSDTHLEQQVDLNVIVREVMEEMADKITETKTLIKAGKLPAIRGNRNQLFYLFKNLISNAIKFQKPGSVPEVTITGQIVNGEDVKTNETAEEFLKISFIDNGFGFDQRYAKKIFQVFQRLHGKHEFEGTGIGLAICKKIMENHQGTIIVQSEQGKGSVFTCIFPLH